MFSPTSFFLWVSLTLLVGWWKEVLDMEQMLFGRVASGWLAANKDLSSANWVAVDDKDLVAQDPDFLRKWAQLLLETKCFFEGSSKTIMAIKKKRRMDQVGCFVSYLTPGHMKLPRGGHFLQTDPNEGLSEAKASEFSTTVGYFFLGSLLKGAPCNPHQNFWILNFSIRLNRIFVFILKPDFKQKTCYFRP